MGEGYKPTFRKSRGTLIADLGNTNDRRLDIFEHKLSRHAQCRNMLRPKKVRSRLILTSTLDTIVGEAINFDSQPDCRAIEIEYVDPRRMLPPEFESARPLAQFAPQQHFGQ